MKRDSIAVNDSEFACTPLRVIEPPVTQEQLDAIRARTEARRIEAIERLGSRYVLASTRGVFASARRA